MRNAVIGMLAKKNNNLIMKLHHPLTLIPYTYTSKACQKTARWLTTLAPKSDRATCATLSKVFHPTETSFPHLYEGTTTVSTSNEQGADSVQSGYKAGLCDWSC